MIAEFRVLKTAVERLGCPEWPDCGDDEGPCFACGQAKAVQTAVEDRDRLRAAAQEVWDSIPGSFDPDDPVVRRHSRALTDLGAALDGRDA